MKNKDRIFLGACLGMPLGLVGMAAGSLLAVIFNKIAGGGMYGKKAKRIKKRK